MKKVFQPLLYALLALAFVLPNANAQLTSVTWTTLSSAITTTNGTILSVTSATGITGGESADHTGLYIDREYVSVLSVSGTTITVQRGAAGTQASTHASGATVYIGAPGNSGPFLGSVGTPNQYRAGSCTASNEAQGPLINIITGAVYNCFGLVWSQSNITASGAPFPPYRVCNVPLNNAAAYSTQATNTTPTSTVTYYGDIFVPQTQKFTGISFLKGATVTNGDLWVMGLYSPGASTLDSLLATTLSTGTATATTANIFQDVPFTTPFIAYGPGQYYIALMGGDEAGDTFGTVPAAGAVVKAGSMTAQTLLTLPTSLTISATAFTAGKSPVVCLY